jgi:hypothetical protein
VAIRLLAGALLTIGPKRNSEALIRGFRSVALPALSLSLPLTAESRSGCRYESILAAKRSAGTHRVPTTGFDEPGTRAAAFVPMQVGDPEPLRAVPAFGDRRALWPLAFGLKGIVRCDADRG